MILQLAQLLPPGEGDNAYVWLSGAIAAALVFVFKLYNDASNAEKTALREDRDKERARNDVLVNSLPEMVSVLRELKDAQADQPH